jgi:Kef-type K+ transport system membrane component KefB
VNLVFAAFLAAFAVVHKERRLFAEALDAIGKVSFAFFIPVYFAVVGLKLDLVKSFSWQLLLIFLVGTCVIKILSVSLAGRLAVPASCWRVWPLMRESSTRPFIRLWFWPR